MPKQVKETLQHAKAARGGAPKPATTAPQGFTAWNHGTGMLAEYFDPSKYARSGFGVFWDGKSSLAAKLQAGLEHTRVGEAAAQHLLEMGPPMRPWRTNPPDRGPFAIYCGYDEDDGLSSAPFGYQHLSQDGRRWLDEPYSTPLGELASKRVPGRRHLDGPLEKCDGPAITTPQSDLAAMDRNISQWAAKAMEEQCCFAIQVRSSAFDGYYEVVLAPNSVAQLQQQTSL